MDIARKIVKFKNGQYGIRRLTFSGWDFLGMELQDGKDFWWGSKARYVENYATGTLDQVKARLAAYPAKKLPRPETPGYDKGKPV